MGSIGAQKLEAQYYLRLLYTSVQMPAARHRRYCGTMYFPTLSKREIWSEYMKDLKSRQVNDSTMKFFSAVKFFQCQPEVCPDTERTSDFCRTFVDRCPAKSLIVVTWVRCIFRR